MKTVWKFLLSQRAEALHKLLGTSSILETPGTKNTGLFSICYFSKIESTKGFAHSSLELSGPWRVEKQNLRLLFCLFH
jgi:hypothetical protein